MRLPEVGDEVDGFLVGECIHYGSKAHLYRVTCVAGQGDPGFPMVMKVPRMGTGDETENIVNFEVEHQVLPALGGPHVPRFVAAGDLERQPYLVMEHVPGVALTHWLARPDPVMVEEVVRLGGALAHAVHSLHLQDVVHLGIKPDNVIVREDGSVVLLDFGLSCHAHFPDLLARQQRDAVGSPGWMAPEQVAGLRGDSRSDVFAIGVMLYQLLTGELPFDESQTESGPRRRLWLDPVPPRQYRPLLPPWVQEVVLRCLAPQVDERYPSAAHLAFDLQHPQQVRVTARGQATRRPGAWTHFRRRLNVAGISHRPSSPQRQITEVPIVMVALPHHEASDATLHALRKATARALGTQAGARLVVVTVIPPGIPGGVGEEDVEVTQLQRYLTQLRHWARPLEQEGHQVSCQVLESGDVARALLGYASANRVTTIVMGAASHGVGAQHLLTTVPVKVTLAAPCTVILVKQPRPFESPGSEKTDSHATD